MNTVKSNISIEEYVSNVLAESSEILLQEIIDHGIHNTTLDIDMETYGYKNLQSEFDSQARELIKVFH